MRKPNLFDYATSELSQDAVLCWLFSWASPAAAEHDQNLHELGIALLRKAYEKHARIPPSEVRNVQVKQQYKNIDVLVRINDSDTIVIEDKVGSTEHSNQLSRYLLNLQQEGVDRQTMLPVYVQAGDQGSYGTVRKAGFVPLLRAELIELLEYAVRLGVRNDIVLDFLDYLTEIERRVQSYQSLPLGEWNRDAWTGFYSKLQAILGDGEWQEVPLGGRGGLPTFMAFWWHVHQGIDSQQYVALKEKKLCFNVHAVASGHAERRKLIEEWNRRIMDAAKGSALRIVSPPRKRPGADMTVAVVDEDYRVPDAKGALSLTSTVEVLRAAEKVLMAAVQEGRASS
jgi:hypothetical protein